MRKISQIPLFNELGISLFHAAIGSSLEDILRREAGKRLLGVILLSDGSQRAYAPRDLPPQTAVARLKNMGYPLFTVPLGQSQGLGQAERGGRRLALLQVKPGTGGQVHPVHG